MRVFVTGAEGFVGRHLVPRLRADGHTLRTSDLELDVADTAAVERAFGEFAPDAVVHLAAQSSVAASFRDPAGTFRTNYLGSRAVLRAAERAASTPRVLLVCSSDTYGSSAADAPPFDETSPLRPRSPYACSKAAADLLGGAYASRGLDVVRVRAFNHTGAGQSDAFVLASFARQLAAIEKGEAEPRMRVGNLDSVRDFLDVRDVVDAYARLLDPAVPAGVYNVASGAGARVGDLLDALVARAGVAPTIEVDPDRYRETDWATGDATRLHDATGWSPRHPLAETLAGLLDYWRAAEAGA